MKSVRLAALLAAVMLFPAAHLIRAQDLTVFAGATMPGDLERDEGKTHFENGPVWGFRLGMGALPFLGFELSAAFSPDYLFPKNTPGVDEAKGFIGNANLIINLPGGRIVPYGTFGVGMIYQYGSENLPVGGEFAINYGGGVKLPRRWGPFGLRIDFRGYTVPSVLSAKLSIFELSGGLLISF